jgi:hypothetical protein
MANNSRRIAVCQISDQQRMIDYKSFTVQNVIVFAWNRNFAPHKIAKPMIQPHKIGCKAAAHKLHVHNFERFCFEANMALYKSLRFDQFRGTVASRRPSRWGMGWVS